MTGSGGVIIVGQGRLQGSVRARRSAAHQVRCKGNNSDDEVIGTYLDDDDLEINDRELA